MIPLDYLALRLVRRHLPDSIVRLLLRRRLLIRPGLETSDPEAALRRFLDAVAAGSRFLTLADGEARPSPEWMTVVNGPLAGYLDRGGLPADLVLSNSVLEHVEDVGSAVPALARATAPGGHQLHFVDLRDHYFKYPFEMLCYRASAWRGLLNPGSNLNRLRMWDYERIFRASFDRVTAEPLAADPDAFRAARARIRPEFMTGGEQDAVTHILVQAWNEGGPAKR